VWGGAEGTGHNMDITWHICLAVTLSVIAHERLAKEMPKSKQSYFVCGLYMSLWVFGWLLASPLPMTATCPS